MVSTSANMSATNPTTAPIRIDLCRPLLARFPFVELRFWDSAPVSARAVVFLITIGSQDFTVRDVGTFSPGIEIDHSFNALVDRWSFLSATPNAECTVKSVDFVDGSRWPVHAKPNT